MSISVSSSSRARVKLTTSSMWGGHRSRTRATACAVPAFHGPTTSPTTAPVNRRASSGGASASMTLSTAGGTPAISATCVRSASLGELPRRLGGSSGRRERKHVELEAAPFELLLVQAPCDLCIAHRSGVPRAVRLVERRDGGQPPRALHSRLPASASGDGAGLLEDEALDRDALERERLDAVRIGDRGREQTIREPEAQLPQRAAADQLGGQRCRNLPRLDRLRRAAGGACERAGQRVLERRERQPAGAHPDSQVIGAQEPPLEPESTQGVVDGGVGRHAGRDESDALEQPLLESLPASGDDPGGQQVPPVSSRPSTTRIGAASRSSTEPR